MAKIKKEKDFFEQSKAFLATFKQIVEEGFFSEFSASIEHSEDTRTLHVSVNATGFLPDKKKDVKVGVQAFVDPVSIVGIIRNYTRTGRQAVIQSRTCSVEIGDWLDSSGTKDTKKGLEVALVLVVTLRLKARS